MSRQPSAETQLRTIRRELRERENQLALERRLRLQYQNRVVVLSKELDEWKERFDCLLRNTGKINLDDK